MYRQAPRGTPLADAVREARIELHEHWGIGSVTRLRPEVYGDGGTVVFQLETDPPEDDTIRQVTSASIDLVESTRLLTALGAERYSELLSLYHERSGEIMHAHGGLLDDPQGDDGCMCYFGVPVAREGSAVAALRAGFELIEAVQALGLSVRIGICTGEVVVRDGQPVGTSVHLAARLQSIAAPGSIAVGESTRRLVGDYFRFQPLQFAGSLKGIEHPEPCFRALPPPLRLGPVEVEVESLRPAMVPFVGRHAELQALEEHWSAVRAGTLRVVRIVGEAGIGKSRLVREFKRSLSEAGHDVFECRCAQEHANSAFRPLISALHAQLLASPADRPDVLLERLRALISGPEVMDDSGLALFADLIGIPMSIRHPVLETSAERRRKLTIDLLVAAARRYAHGPAACMIVEDIHWMDPSTAEYLGRLVREGRTLPLLVVVTARADTLGGWRPRVPIHEMELRGLSSALSRALVLGTCGDHGLPREVVHLIAARSDGVPLFIEESTRMVLESRSGGKPAQDRDATSVPTTILELLTTRLDRLGSAKHIAQVGGTIGREFPLSLLEAVLRDPRCPFGAADLEVRLEALQRSGMLIARVDPDGTHFAFKHVLMRDAAYRSLLTRDRSRLHHVIASVIGTRFPELGERHPELLAFHYTEASLDVEALRMWEIAARQAASRSAQLEAIDHVESALGVLLRTQAGADRDRLELRLQLLLAARLIATSGYGADRVERVYARAMQLAEGLGDQAALMRVLLGLEGYHFMRADFDQAKAYVLRAASWAGGGGRGATHEIQTRWALANIVMHQGEMTEAVAQMDQCLAQCDRLEHRPESVQDPRVMCLCYSGWSKWQLGFPDDALARVTRVVELAERMKHTFSLGEAHGFRAAVHQFRGESNLALHNADRAVSICEEGGFAVWLAHARILRGRAMCDLALSAPGVEEMREGYDLWSSTGAVVTTPFYLTLRAEGLALCQRHDEALSLLEEALSIVERTGERYYEADVRRLTGRLLWERGLRANLDQTEEAERWLLQALECATSRRMLSLALRAATDLAELWASQGRIPAAMQLLRPAYDAITEGRTTRDLVRAREQLVALESLAQAGERRHA